MGGWKHDIRTIGPDMDALRAAIGEADERARRLRRLLRLTVAIREAEDAARTQPPTTPGEGGA